MKIKDFFIDFFKKILLVFMLINVEYSWFSCHPRGDSPLKIAAKILPFFLIGIILLRNYHPRIKKNCFKSLKRQKLWQKNRKFSSFGDKLPILLPK